MPRPESPKRGAPALPVALFTGVRGRLQLDEKVGAELIVTTNRAPEAPIKPKYGVFGTQSGVKASVEGVFQQAGKFSEVWGGALSSPYYFSVP